MRKSERVIYITLIDFLLQLLFLGVVLWVIFYVNNKPGNTANDDDWKRKYGEAQKEAEEWKRKYGEAQREAEEWKRKYEEELKRRLAGNGLNDAPPQISLKEAKGFTFAKGEYKLNNAAVKKFKEEIVPKIEENVGKYQINLVEVIGHTDGTEIKDRGNCTPSNLMDKKLEEEAVKPFIDNEKAAADICYRSNVELGILRALEIVKLLKEVKQSDPSKFKDIKIDTGFRAASSGQLIDPTGKFSDGKQRISQDELRRVEIRLTRVRDEIDQ